MANYLYTNEAGTSRRRAKQVIINNPSEELGYPSITFIEEDRIIMADGTIVYVEVPERRVVTITPELLAKVIPSFNVETGETTNKDRRGYELMGFAFQAIADIYIFTGMELNNNA